MDAPYEGIVAIHSRHEWQVAPLKLIHVSFTSWGSEFAKLNEQLHPTTLFDIETTDSSFRE